MFVALRSAPSCFVGQQGYSSRRQNWIGRFVVNDTAREASPVIAGSKQCAAFHKTTPRLKHCFDQVGESFSLATNRSGDGEMVLQDKMPSAWHLHSYRQRESLACLRPESHDILTRDGPFISVSFISPVYCSTRPHL